MKDKKNNNSINSTCTEREVTRRHFLKTSSLLAVGLATSTSCMSMGGGKLTGMTFGIVTDSHYADKPGGGRVYRESLAKMTECTKLMNEKNVAFLVELGDFTDHGHNAEASLKHLDAIEAVFKKFKGPRHHVLGNHDMGNLSKQQFMAHITNTGIDKDKTYYSYDSKGVHFVVLDACFTSKGASYDKGNYGWKDTAVPPQELEWLEKDLASTSKPVIAFCHQQLCGEGAHYVNNAAEVREVLQKNKNVLGVFQGHNHGGGHKQIEGIHYYTLKAMVEGAGEANNSYAIVEVKADMSMTVTGYRKATSIELPKK